jgi:hypothetical protein
MMARRGVASGREIVAVGGVAQPWRNKPIRASRQANQGFKPEPRMLRQADARLAATLVEWVDGIGSGFIPKSEARRPKSGKNPKPEGRTRGFARAFTRTFSERRKTRFGFGISGCFRISGIRIGDFGFIRVSK